jgi:putative transposase
MKYSHQLTETINGLFKNKLVGPRKPWSTVGEIELATLERVWWFNNSRMHSERNNQTPADYEANYYNSQPAKMPTGILVKH